MEPVFAPRDRRLDDDVLVPRVNADLRRRAPFTATRGRPSTPVEVLLRRLVVKRLYHWSDEATEHVVADRRVLCQCCRLDRPSVPDDTTLRRGADVMAPETLTALHERVGELARALKGTRGRQRRGDSLVGETTLHHPTDSGLISAGGRVRRRVLRRAKAMVGQAPGLGQAAFRRRLRRVRRLGRPRHRLARRQREEATAQLRLA
jgi:transposase, IS5 family